jgi:hypothetical protein
MTLLITVNKIHKCNVIFIDVISKVVISKVVISKVVISKVVISKVVISKVFISIVVVSISSHFSTEPERLIQTYLEKRQGLLIGKNLHVQQTAHALLQ